FFQAEDGIRDFHVTGVQTCALPICRVGDRELRTEEPAVFGFGGAAQTARLRLATNGGGRLNLDARLDDTAADLRAQLTRLDLQLDRKSVVEGKSVRPGGGGTTRQQR